MSSQAIGLKSKLFKGDPALEACLISHPAHIMQGGIGNHVSKIQTALATLDGAVIDSGELSAKRYGTTTAAAVLAYKTKRNIVNQDYQNKADNIVGKMTIKSLDDEMLRFERTPLIIPKIPPPMPFSHPKCKASTEVFRSILTGLGLSNTVLGGPEGVFDFQNTLPNDVILTLNILGVPAFTPVTVTIPSFGSVSRTFTHLIDPAPITWRFDISASSSKTIPPGVPFIPPGSSIPLPVLVRAAFSTNWRPGEPTCIM
jgi:hypothetical protein